MRNNNDDIKNVLCIIQKTITLKFLADEVQFYNGKNNRDGMTVKTVMRVYRRNIIYDDMNEIPFHLVMATSKSRGTG